MQDNLKVGTLLVFKPHKSPKLTFINDTLHGLYGTKNAIESKNILSAGNFWSQGTSITEVLHVLCAQVHMMISILMPQ